MLHVRKETISSLLSLKHHASFLFDQHREVIELLWIFLEPCFLTETTRCFVHPLKKQLLFYEQKSKRLFVLLWFS